MPTNTIVRVKIDRELKNEAAAILETVGLTPSDAFRIMMTRIASRKSFPFDLLIPNKETIAAMKEARKGKLKSFTSANRLMASLKRNC